MHAKTTFVMKAMRIYFVSITNGNLLSIAFVEDKGPCELTCSEHNCSTKLFMVHTCLWKQKIPGKKLTNFSKAIIQPRLLKPVKASKYSIGFRMFYQTGTFNGIYTCSATSLGSFRFQIYSLCGSRSQINTKPPWYQ